MRVVIAGGHGKIALLLSRLLADRGDEVAGIVRDPAQSEDLAAAGAAAIVADLEALDAGELAERIGSADAVVFAAGAGPGSGDARKATMDEGGAVKLIEAARANGIDRYVIVSSMGADPDIAEDATGFDAYSRAKGRADAALASSGLRFTIVRPGGLTDDPPTGAVRLAEHVDRGAIPRADVAAVLAEALLDDRSAGRTVEVVAGDQPVGGVFAG